MKNTSIHSLAAQTHAHGTSSNARGRAHPGSRARVLEASEVGEVEGRHRNLHGSRSLSPPSRPPQKPSWKHRAQTQGSGANSSKAERTALTQTKLRPFHRGARCENSKAQGSLDWASQAVVPTCQGFDCMNFSLVFSSLAQPAMAASNFSLRGCSRRMANGSFSHLRNVDLKVSLTLVSPSANWQFDGSQCI